MDRLTGMYLYGSLVSGGFDEVISDIDLLAVSADEVTDDDLLALRQMHARFVESHPAWEDRIEVAYLSVSGLRTFKERTSQLAIISPGEPMHFKEAGRDWLVNWYLVRESGVTLCGPPPETIIAQSSRAEYLEGVRAYAHEMIARGPALRARSEQSYAILTLCRALCTHRTGAFVSKADAAAWTRRALPEWADLIGDALVWRATSDEHHGDHGAALPAVQRFIDVVRQEIDGVGQRTVMPPGRAR